MRISYNRLWKLLIDKNLKKKDLMELAKKAINLNNYIDVTLIPEKESL